MRQQLAGGVVQLCYKMGRVALPMALLFPASHDEAYNFTRLWLKYSATKDFSDWETCQLARKEYRYGYQSPTTTARNDFSGSSRTIFAFTGLVLLVALHVAYFLHLFK